MRKEGFLLLEFLWYVLAASLLTIFFLHAVVTIVRNLYDASSYAQRVTSLYAMAQRVTNELEKVNAAQATWLFPDRATVIWHEGKKDYSWSLQECNLVHIEGEYNQERRTWEHKKVTKGASDIESLQMQPTWSPDGNYLALLTITLQATMPHKANLRITRLIKPQECPW